MFKEEFVIVLREKNDAELKGMEESGRMKRWTPMSDDYSSMPSASAQRLCSERKGTGSQVVGDFVRLSHSAQWLRCINHYYSKVNCCNIKQRMFMEP
jgi:hypothetical protein